ncbi:argininosuccinate lyase [Lignipirellula cremea]|uniref:Argininosuccinate lyase n=1 Tax=Lignipirellula cremea TaxID=2528010 RepID=A0A518DZI5_9BACT|nr:argininosuccinate lyase [Lignipirellula cremea]QDU97254.1 Argininosuccinate lyase [Lignipirellula cremea]
MESPSHGGVFNKPTDKLVVKFTESVSFDRHLLAHDIDGSIAHAEMLHSIGVLTQEESEQIASELLKIRQEIEEETLKLSIDLEDIHMNVEQALIDRLGDLGRKLHTGRSRNDQVSTDMRMWVRNAIDHIDKCLYDVQRAFLSRCTKDADFIIPAYTHMQRAQPVLAAHYWLAFIEKFHRDRRRLASCRKRVNICSLGSAAVAGTSIPIDREMVAAKLGFESVARNSVDVSSDRDFVLETAFALTMIAEHLSAWAEEWIIWSTAEFNFLKLPEEFCTGSSIMPQKINPDVLELIRGKSARVIGNLQTLLVLMKGLPLAYNRDMQEDKPALFDSVRTVKDCLSLAALMIEQTELRREQIQKRLDTGYLDATSLMEFLIRRGTPQRQAHHAVGSLVRRAMDQQVRLEDLTLEEFKSVDASLDYTVYNVLGVKNAVEAFVSYGSTAPAEVQRQVKFWKERLSSSQS